MLFTRSKKQKAEEELEQAHAESLAKNRKIDIRASKREEASKLGASGGMLETLQAIYVEQVDQGEMIEESDEHLEDIHAELEGSAFEERQEKIRGSNKEKRDSSALGKFTSGVKGAFGAVGAGFGKVKDSLSGKFGLVALGGAIVLMNKFSDELFGPEGALTKLLEWMKYDMIPAIKKLYDWVVVGWDKAWSGVAGFFEWAHGVFTKISDYFKSFDKDGDGSLNPEEMKLLQKDIADRITKFASEVISGVFGSLTGWLTAALLVRGPLWWTLRGLWTGMMARFAAGGPLRNAGKDLVKKPSLWSRIFSGSGGAAAASSFKGVTKLDLNKLPAGTRLNAAGSLIHAEGPNKGKIITTAEKLKLIPQKYSMLKSAARKIPFLGPIITSALGIQLLNSDDSHEEKVIGMGRLIGEAAGSFGFATLGASIGAAFAGVGAIPGALIGALGGFYGGGWVGEKVARFLMGESGDEIISTESLHQGNISKLNEKKEEVLAAQQGLSPGSPEFLANQEKLGLIDQALAFEQAGLNQAAQTDANLQFNAKTDRLAEVNRTIAREKASLPLVAPTGEGKAAEFY